VDCLIPSQQGTHADAKPFVFVVPITNLLQGHILDTSGQVSTAASRPGYLKTGMVDWSHSRPWDTPFCSTAALRPTQLGDRSLERHGGPATVAITIA
jgi:hypothetical protein